MSKYIIKNCPCFYQENEEVYDYTCAWSGTEELACQDCTDCVMKQIVEKCKAEKNLRPDANIDDDFANEILGLLDIQEVK